MRCSRLRWPMQGFLAALRLIQRIFRLEAVSLNVSDGAVQIRHHRADCAYTSGNGGQPCVGCWLPDAPYPNNKLGQILLKIAPSQRRLPVWPGGDRNQWSVSDQHGTLFFTDFSYPASLISCDKIYKIFEELTCIYLFSRHILKGLSENAMGNVIFQDRPGAIRKKRERKVRLPPFFPHYRWPIDSITRLVERIFAYNF